MSIAVRPTNKEALLAQITANPRLPSPSGVAMQVLQKANSPDCTIAELGKLISHDPGLCSKLLRMVNSTLFGLPRAITSIERALNLLGLKRVRSLVLSLSLPAMRFPSLASERLQEFWKFSAASGIVARELATRLQYQDPDSEMVTALLSDLGVLILQETYPEAYGWVLANSLEVLLTRQCELEEHIIGVNHAEVSAFILRRWGLPEDVTEAILHHHSPLDLPPEVHDRAAFLYFAQRVAHLQFSVDPGVRVGEIVSLASERYGLTDHGFRTFLEPLAGKIKDFASVLQVNVGPCEQFPTLLALATENLSRMAAEASLDNVRVEEEKIQAELELKKTEEALRETEEKLRQALKLEAIGRLAGGVAHDFNNLLTIINGYGELLLQTMPATDPYRPMIEEIKRASDRATDVTQQLLAFSRKQILVPVVVNLNDQVSNMEKMLRRLIGEDIELVTVLNPKLVPVRVDPGQLSQVLINLAVNARDAMPRGGKLTVETANVELDEHYVAPYADLKPGPYALLAISDTGLGMTEEVKSRVFEPFFTTKEGKGTGLGLATVHGIIKQSGGHISVYSELGHGTTFKVYLPAMRASDPDIVLPEPPPQAFHGNETVLLTEDEDGVRRIARRMLESYGYRVLEARHGNEALEVSSNFSGPIHVLVTDTVMPQMGGPELAQQMKRLRPNIKVLYTSGYTDDAVVRHGVLRSGAPFLQKPFTPQALASKVREVLAGNPLENTALANVAVPNACLSL